jgi:hypothetical protein
MRGGSIPLLAWGTLLLVLMVINLIWTGDAIQVGTFGFAVLAIWGFAVALFVLRRESIRRGPPPATMDPEAIPDASFSALLIGLSVACILFGVVWSTFLVYFGAGMLLLSLGRMGLELRAERDTRRRIGTRGPR